VSQIEFPFGSKKIKVEIPDKNVLSVLKVRYLPVVDSEKAIKFALDHPIRSPKLENLLQSRDKVAIIVDDITRPTPTHYLLGPLLKKLSNIGVLDRDITIIFANGAHRKVTRKEQEYLLGKDILSRIKTVNHDAKNKSSTKYLGKTSRGTRIGLNRLVVDADLRILLGCIKPHSEAGYTGGAKSIIPGTAGLDTILMNHSYEAIAHPSSALGVIEGNPMREDMEEVTKMIGSCFIINVVVNPCREIVGVVTGESIGAHREGAKILDKMAKIKVSEKADVTITGCPSPIDISLYQALNALVCPIRVTEPIVKKGGTIVLVAECREGIGHMAFYDLVKKFRNPRDLLGYLSSGKISLDQYAAQLWAEVLNLAHVIVVTQKISKKELSEMGVEHASTIEQALKLAELRIGPNMKILAIPDAPYIIPFLEKR